ncbi:MAG: hypothetical protein D6798_16035 [Deltaproteobacteria bacterium]|nr:MAG: hypothetical protein D6798_16035 [Deltaproteobacteria bacterium]
MNAARVGLAASLLIVPGLAMARPVQIAGATASSTYPPQEGTSYEARNLYDRKVATAWFEGDDGSGLGAWVELDLGGPHTLTGLRIWNGYWLTWDMWQRNNRVKNLEVETADGQEFSFELTDEMKPEDIRFPKAVTTDRLKLRIKGIHKGNTFNDTAISEIQVLDDQPPEFVVPTGFQASSTYPEDGDGDYEAENLADGILDSMWCEGDKEGDGTGQWVQEDFGAPTRVSKLVIYNGNAFSFSSFMKANSATAATLTFSDGSTESIAIKPSMMKQTISFTPHTTSSVRITFDTVRRGKEFNDLCISEAVFLP